VEYTIRAGLALGCKIAEYTRWDRKNYFYPDLPKAYQISQLYNPICLGGGMEVNSHFVRLNRIHLEEDAGKLIHDDVNRISMADYNRCSVPLIEIVTEPDLRSEAEAAEFVERVRLALIYAGVCDGRMEQGSLRVDANISLMPEGSETLGTRTEIKNLNSLKSVTRAISYEIQRQGKVLDLAQSVKQETRRFNDNLGKTSPMRSKEDAHDYRYFPDPDIPPLRITPEEVESIAKSLPELPEAKRVRYVNELGLSLVEANTLIERKLLADYFDDMLKVEPDAQVVSNWVLGEIARQINLLSGDLEKIPVSTADLAKIIRLIREGSMTAASGKTAVRFLFEAEGTLDEIVSKHTLIVKEDAGAIEESVKQVLDANPNAVAQWLAGDKKVFGFFMGEVNRALKGQAKPQSIKETLEQMLASRT
jgi:aspartyl-tRNA(Asn)/glutamyl-tRNA(Gln) amidotransferase subunit B